VIGDPGATPGWSYPIATIGTPSVNASRVVFSPAWVMQSAARFSSSIEMPFDQAESIVMTIPRPLSVSASNASTTGMCSFKICFDDFA
jgi:hypothetical protein